MTPLVRKLLIAAAVVGAVVLVMRWRRRMGGAPADAMAENPPVVPRLTMEARATQGTQVLPPKIAPAVFNAPLAGLRRPANILDSSIAAVTSGLGSLSRSRIPASGQPATGATAAFTGFGGLRAG